MRTVIGKSVAKISSLCHNLNLDDLTADIVKKTIRYADIQDTETWRIELVKDMWKVLSNESTNTGLTLEEATSLLEHACIS